MFFLSGLSSTEILKDKTPRHQNSTTPTLEFPGVCRVSIREWRRYATKYLASEFNLLISSRGFNESYAILAFSERTHARWATVTRCHT